MIGNGGSYGQQTQGSRLFQSGPLLPTVDLRTGVYNNEASNSEFVLIPTQGPPTLVERVKSYSQQFSLDKLKELLGKYFSFLILLAIVLLICFVVFFSHWAKSSSNFLYHAYSSAFFKTYYGGRTVEQQNVRRNRR